MTKFRKENSQDSGTFSVWLLGFLLEKGIAERSF
jgi:hypothetical protein